MLVDSLGDNTPLAVEGGRLLAGIPPAVWDKQSRQGVGLVVAGTVPSGSHSCW